MAIVVKFTYFLTDISDYVILKQMLPTTSDGSHRLYADKFVRNPLIMKKPYKTVLR